MASISVVLLGLNPDTRIRPVVEYLRSRGVPGRQQLPGGLRRRRWQPAAGARLAQGLG
jgi:hypothetical protein